MRWDLGPYVLANAPTMLLSVPAHRAQEPPDVAWYTSPDHPRGEGVAPCFEVVGTFVYPSYGHPMGASTRPWYQLRGQFAYPVDGHPDGPSSQPSLRVVEAEVHPFAADCDSDGSAAWFRIERIERIERHER